MVTQSRKLSSGALARVGGVWQPAGMEFAVDASRILINVSLIVNIASAIVLAWLAISALRALFDRVARKMRKD